MCVGFYLWQNANGIVSLSPNIHHWILILDKEQHTCMAYLCANCLEIDTFATNLLWCVCFYHVSLDVSAKNAKAFSLLDPSKR